MTYILRKTKKFTDNCNIYESSASIKGGSSELVIVNNAEMENILKTFPPSIMTQSIDSFMLRPPKSYYTFFVTTVGSRGLKTIYVAIVPLSRPVGSY